MEYLDKILVPLRDSIGIPFPIKNQNISEKFPSQYMFFMILVFFALFSFPCYLETILDYLRIFLSLLKIAPWPMTNGIDIDNDDDMMLTQQEVNGDGRMEKSGVLQAVMNYFSE